MVALLEQAKRPVKNRNEPLLLVPSASGQELELVGHRSLIRGVGRSASVVERRNQRVGKQCIVTKAPGHPERATFELKALRPRSDKADPTPQRAEHPHLLRAVAPIR